MAEKKGSKNTERINEGEKHHITEGGEEARSVPYKNQNNK